MPSCSILADQKQPATGLFISRGQSSRYFLSGGCYESMCFSTPPRVRNDEMTAAPFLQIAYSSLIFLKFSEDHNRSTGLKRTKCDLRENVSRRGQSGPNM